MAISIPWLAKRRGRAGRVGLAVGPDGLAVAFFNASQKLVFCRFYEQPGDIGELIEQLVSEHGWEAASCSVVLHPVYYQLLLAEVPAVQEAEIPQAVRWKVKELLDYPLEQAAIEYFLLPEDAFRGRQKMLYAAALRKSTLKGLVEPIEAAGLDVDCIEIAELALHKLVARLPAEPGGAAFVQLHEGEGYMNLVEDGEIYLCRRLDVGLEKLYPDGDNSVFFESLLLGIQRSLDYYESQLDKGIVTHLYYSPGLTGVKPVGDFLSAQLGLNVVPLSLTGLGIDTDLAMSDEDVLRCATAIGAALQTRPALEKAAEVTSAAH